MNNDALIAVLRIIRIEALIQSRATGVLGGVHGVSLNETIILMTLSRAEGGRMRRVDLANALGVSQATITRSVAPMERIGLVRRVDDGRDARVALVAITDAGRVRAEEAELALARVAGALFENSWTAEEVSKFTDMLGRLTAAFPGPVV